MRIQYDTLEDNIRQLYQNIDDLMVEISKVEREIQILEIAASPYYESDDGDDGDGA